MPEYKIDLHCHSHFSLDGVSHPLRMVERAHEVGLNGFVLTDHDTQRGVEYFRRKGLIREDGKAHEGLLIIPGQEVSTYEGHVLAIGVKLDPMPGVRCAELLQQVHAAGGICIAAHPFDPARRGVGRKVLNEIPFDGVEVFNAASWFPGLNPKAYHYAKVRGQLMTAGSDSHHPASLGRSHQIVDAAELSVSAVLDALKSGQCRRHERLMRLQDYIIKSWFNLCRPETPIDETLISDRLSDV
jgi:hypothetical protein